IHSWQAFAASGIERADVSLVVSADARSASCFIRSSHSLFDSSNAANSSFWKWIIAPTCFWPNAATSGGSIVDPAAMDEPSSCRSFVIACLPGLRSWIRSVDDVVAAVDIERLSGDQLGRVVREEGGGDADVVDADQAAGRGGLARLV